MRRSSPTVRRFVRVARGARLVERITARWADGPRLSELPARRRQLARRMQCPPAAAERPDHVVFVGCDGRRERTTLRPFDPHQCRASADVARTQCSAWSRLHAPCDFACSDAKSLRRGATKPRVRVLFRPSAPRARLEPEPATAVGNQPPPSRPPRPRGQGRTVSESGSPAPRSRAGSAARTPPHPRSRCGTRRGSRPASGRRRR